MFKAKELLKYVMNESLKIGNDIMCFVKKGKDNLPVAPAPHTICTQFSLFIYNCEAICP